MVFTGQVHLKILKNQNLSKSTIKGRNGRGGGELA